MWKQQNFVYFCFGRGVEPNKPNAAYLYSVEHRTPLANGVRLANNSDAVTCGITDTLNLIRPIISGFFFYFGFKNNVGIWQSGGFLSDAMDRKHAKSNRSQQTVFREITVQLLWLFSPFFPLPHLLYISTPCPKATKKGTLAFCFFFSLSPLKTWQLVKKTSVFYPRNHTWVIFRCVCALAKN